MASVLSASVHFDFRATRFHPLVSTRRTLAMARDKHERGLHDTQAHRSTSPAVKIAGYGAIALLLLAIILLATGAVKFGPY